MHTYFGISCIHRALLCMFPIPVSFRQLLGNLLCQFDSAPEFVTSRFVEPPKNKGPKKLHFYSSIPNGINSAREIKILEVYEGKVSPNHHSPATYNTSVLPSFPPSKLQMT